MITAFKNYLLSLGLSAVSRKLYLSDIRRFLTWLSQEVGKEIDSLTLDILCQNKYYISYLAALTDDAIAPSMYKRTTSSLRQFTSFLAHSYAVDAPSLTNQDAQNNTFSALSSLTEDYIKSFAKYLTSQHLSPLTIKSYKSDITRYLDWVHSVSLSSNMAILLTPKNIEKYLNYLDQSINTSSSTIERKSKSLARFQSWFLNHVKPSTVSDNNNIPSSISELPFIVKSTSISTLKLPPFTLPILPSPGKAITSVKNHISRILDGVTSVYSTIKPMTSNQAHISTLAILLVFAISLSYFGYRSFSKETKLIAAYPSSPVNPNRNLSFQGRLEDAGGTPITSATNFEFKLWNSLSGGSQLYTTSTCSITPDSDGVFSTQIGSDCGAAIDSSVFTENANVFLEVLVGSSPQETLTPRQPIASVAYALNSETLQGFPVSATVSAIRNTIVPMNQWGEIIIGEQNPRMTGVSGNFQISAPSLIFTTSSNGNIALSPNGTGQVNVNGGTTTTNFFNIANSSLTTGSLITGTVANANTGFKLLNLLSGSSPTSKFSVDDAGNTTMAGDLTVSGNDITMGTNTAGMLLIADGTNFSPTAITGDVTITGGGVTTIGTDKITEAMLKVVNSPTDELCLSYESTVGDFEWQTCGGGVTADSLNFTDFIDNMTLDASTDIAATGTNVLSISNTGTGNSLLVNDETTDTTPFVIDTSGNVGIGKVTPNAKLDVAGAASVSGTLILGNGTTNTLRSPYGPLSFDYKSGLDTWGTAMTIQDSTGNIGIGDTTPVSLFTIGSGDLFQINSSGIISTIDGVAHTIEDVTGDLTISSSSTLVNINDDLKITGDDLFMTTNTAGYLLVADGTNYNPTIMSGDITINGSGATSIGTDKITEAMLKVVNSPTDELCLSYESTVGDFEWQTCGGGVTADSLDFTDFMDNMTLDASTNIATTGTNVLSITNSGTGNSFVVNDVSGDTTPFAIDLNGNMSVGGTINSIEGVAHTIDDVSGNLTLTSNSTSVTIADDLAVNGATSADITSTTATATLFDTTVTSLSLGGAATTLNMGAGGALARAINIGTGTGVDTINIGTGTTGADVITIGNNASSTTLNLTSGTGGIAASSTTQTGVGMDLSVDSITSGTGLLIDNNIASSLTTGTLLEAQSVATSLTTAGDAFLGYFNWNPGSATTATGDLFRINIGANGTATNLFNVTDNGSSLFAISETGVSMVNNLNFTNPTASSITSAAPLTIVAGETFNSSNLTLKTYNSGDVVIDAAGGVTLNQAQIWDLANSSTTSLNIESGLMNFDTTNSRIGIGNTAPNTTLDVTGTASISGTLTLGNGTTNTLRSPYGPLSFDYKSGLDTWGTAITIKDTTGYVGIGTTTPSQALSVSGNQTISGILYTDNIHSNSATNLTLDAINASQGINFNTQYTTRMSILSNGNVGIGTTGPDRKLDILDASNPQLRLTQADGTVYSDFQMNSSGDLVINVDGISNQLVLDDAGGIAIGTTTPISLFHVTGKVTGKALAILDETGDQDILTASASGITKFRIRTDGYVEAVAFADIASPSTAYLNPNETGTSLSIAGDILNTDGANQFSISSTTNQNIVINAGSGTVQIGAAGAGKLDAATIDPPYTINGLKYATYMASMTGVKEETTGNVIASEYIEGKGYRATLDLANSPDSSDIWLFSKTTNLKHNLDRMVVLLSSSGNTKTWYDIEPSTGKLYLYAQAPTTISYRLTAPRYDAQNWLNTRDINANTGLIINDTSDWSVSSAIVNIINAGKTQVASLFGNIETNLISPLDTTKPIEITGPVAIKPTSHISPALTVDGEILAATISARLVRLDEVEATTANIDQLTAKNIIADTITANHIEGLDARIASLSGKLSDQEITSITDRIKNRLTELTGNLPTASDLPVPIAATSSAIIDSLSSTDLESSIASGSAILSSLSADFATINGYLAVIGQTTMTNLDITNVLYTSTIDSKTGTINLAQNTLIIDSTGTVAINGDLVVSGKILAESASIGSIEIGTPSDATSSALGKLLSVYNESGVAVATIDASGSANLTSLTTGMITISGSADATSSALLASQINAGATAGVSTMISPDTQLTIATPYVTKDTLVYLTPTTNTQNKVLFVKSKNLCDINTVDTSTTCTPSFTVAIDSPAASDISFNWWIIQVK